jgi:hypothetical protein
MRKQYENTNKMGDWKPDFKFTAGGTGGDYVC